MEEIKFDKRNYRKHDKKNKSLIKKSLEKFGAGRSIVVDAEGEIIGGNGVYEQAQKLGLKTKIVETDGSELVVVKRTDLKTDDEKRKALAVMDNSTSDTSEFDLELLTADFTVDELSDFGIELPEEEEEEQNKEVKEVEVPDEVESRCKLGDLWKLGNHRLICGDSSDYEVHKKLMQEEKADLLFTDPPYGVAIGSKNKTLNKATGQHSIDINIKNDNIKMKDLVLMLDKVFTNTKLFLKSSAMLYITIPLGFIFDFYKVFENNRIPIRYTLIWKKNKRSFSLGRLDYEYDFEGIIYTWLDKHTNYRKSKFRTTTWEIDAPRKCDLHPTMKPIELLEGVLLDGTKEGDIVIDYFGGSGTTLICAEQMNRQARLIELDPHYCDVIIQRWENLTGKKAELITDAD